MTSPRGLILAVDIGSSSIKSSLFNATGTMLRKSKVILPVCHSNGQIELDLSDLWEAFKISVGTVILPEHKEAEPAQIRGIGITTQMTGLILLDSTYRPLRKAILGVDQRGLAYVSKLPGLTGGENIQAVTGCPLKSIYPTAKMLWIAEHEPKNLDLTSYLGGIKEYILWKLTGQWVTDSASASTTQMYDQRNRKWWLPFIGKLDIKRSWLPTIKSPDEAAGYITPAAAMELNLAEEIIVSVGTGDGPAANLATGSVSKDQLCISLGTTAVTRYMTVGSDETLTEENMLQQHFRGNHYLRGLRVEGAGAAIEDALSDAALQDILNQILFSLYDRMKPVLQRQSFSEIRPIGGGAVNEQWMRDIADLFQLPLVVTESTDSTLGAAILTAVCLEYYHSLHEAGEHMVRIKKRIDPIIQRSNELHQQYERYVAGLKGEELHE